jgi:hypothetical protein
MRGTARRDQGNDRRLARQGNLVFWMTLVAGLLIVVALIVLVAR